MAPVIGEVAHDPVNVRAIKQNGRGRSTGISNVPYAAALLMEYFFTNPHGGLLGYIPPPHSIQTVLVIGKVAHDPVNARR